MAPRSSRGKSIRQSGARPPQPRAVSVQDLGKLQGLAGLSPRKLEALRARMRIRQFSKRSVVYKEGESDDAVYIVLSGIARLICLNRKGKRNLLEVLGPGDVIQIPRFSPAHISVDWRALTRTSPTSCRSISPMTATIFIASPPAGRRSNGCVPIPTSVSKLTR